MSWSQSGTSTTGPTPFADTFTGDPAGNFANGGLGRDSLIGNAGNDTLLGDFDRDIISGGADNDSIDGGAGNDFLDGNDGADTIEGGAGTDEIYGGADDGDDLLTDSLDGAGWVFAGNGNDTILVTLAGAFDNTGGFFSNFLDGGAGNDFIGLSGDGTVFGSGLYGQDGNDTLVGAGAFASLFGQNDDDSIQGGSAGEALSGGQGNDTIDGGAGADTIYGEDIGSLETGDDSILGGLGDDLIDGGQGNDTIDGGDDDDSILGSDGNDLLSGGGENDTLFGGEGNDTLAPGAADDDGTQVVDGGAGIDRVVYAGGDAVFVALTDGSGTAAQQNDGDPDQLTDIEEVEGSGFDDTMAAAGTLGMLFDGGAGNDRLVGGDGDDTLLGGEGNDTVIGGSLGWDSMIGGDGINTLDFSDANGPVQFHLAQREVWEDGNPTANWPDTTNINGDPAKVPEYIEGFTVAYGSQFGDGFMAGSEVGDSIFGQGGDDRIFGNTGDDTLDGGIDHDYVVGEEGNDLLIGGEGDDLLVGGRGNLNTPMPDPEGGDTIDIGGETVFGADTLLGGEGNDLAFGMEGRDSLVGGAGDDFLNGGTGADTLEGGTGSDIINGGDSVEFGTEGDVLSITREADLVTYANAGSGVSFSLVFDEVGGGGVVDDGDGDADELFGVEQVIGSAFDDTMAMHWDVPFEGVLMAGGDGNDSIVMSGLSPATLEGDDGNDTIAGGEMSDLIRGGEGDDVITDAAGGGLFIGGEGNDSIVVSASGDGIAQILGDAGNDTILAPGIGFGDPLTGESLGVSIDGGADNDSIVGSDAADLLFGGSDDDTITGGSGDDTVDAGTGQDVVTWRIGDGNDSLVGGDGFDVLDLEGWTPGGNADWLFNISGGDTVYTHVPTGSVINAREFESITCFAPGTHILTAHGEVPVERLRAGDLVAAPGRGAPLKPVRWVGHTRVDIARHRDKRKVAPVLIRAGALGAGVPARDLRVSPEHAFLLDGRLVAAHLLVNGTTIIQETWQRAMTYWHVELEEHGVLVAEGALAESYFDDGNRHLFDNSVFALHVDFAAGRAGGRYVAEAFAPPLLDADDPALARIRARLRGAAPARRSA